MDAVKKELLMDAFADDYMTPEAIELVARARALAPKLAERAREAERQGMVPVETVKEMQEAGLFRVLQPKRWGGYELDPRVFYRVQMALAEGCMSTAWIYGVIGVHNWQLPLFPDQAQQDVWGQNSATLIASTYMPVGKAEKVEGGYRFSGRWAFSSGVEHCEWIFLGGLLLQLHPGADQGRIQRGVVHRAIHRRQILRCPELAPGLAQLLGLPFLLFVLVVEAGEAVSTHTRHC